MTTPFALSLTDRGRTVFESLKPVLLRRQEQMLAVLSSRERDQLKTLLKKLSEGVSEWAYDFDE